MLTTEIKLAIAAGALLLAFGLGWLVKGWKDSGEIRALQGVVAVQKESIDKLMGANERCTIAVGDVKAAVKAYVDAGDERSRKAMAAIQAAAASAQGHLSAATAALNRPPAPPGQECETAADEASAYARKRKAAP